MTLNIEQATVFDLEQLVPLFDGYRQFYGTSSDLALARQFLADRMTQNQSVVLLARGADGGALGFAQLFPSFSSVRASPIYVLNDLFVAPLGRRRGVGRHSVAAGGSRHGPRVWRRSCEAIDCDHKRGSAETLRSHEVGTRRRFSGVQLIAVGQKKAEPK